MRQTPFLPIWQRYFIKEIGKVFLAILLLFFVLFTVIDYSIHMQGFLRNQTVSLKEVSIYYFFQCFKRIDILLPLSLLVAVIKVITTLNQRRELVALFVAGLSVRSLVRPLFFLSLLSSLLVFANFEWALPHSLAHIDQFYAKELKNKNKKRKKETLHIWHLTDGSKLIYQSIDKARNSLFDCLWIRSHREFWKIKYLEGDPSHPIARFADHFVKDETGFFEKKESHPEISLEGLHWSSNMPQKGYFPAEMLSPSTLLSLIITPSPTPLYRQEELLSHLLFKCMMPLIAPIGLLGLLPLCITYRRKIPFFALYALFLFGLIIFAALMDALLILGENLILPPFWAICTPFLVLGLLFGLRFARSIRS